MSGAKAATFRELLNCWPSDAALARDLDISPATVGSWRHRDAITERWWDDLVRSAANNGIRGVTRAKLLRLHRGRRERGRMAVPPELSHLEVQHV